MGRWRDKLLEKSQRSTQQEPTKPTKAPSVGFVGSSGADISKKRAGNTSELEHTKERPQVRDWCDLEAGELPQNTVAAVPDGNAVRVYLSDLLANPTVDENTCRYCSHSEWWDNAGQRTCGICHPKHNGRG